MYPFVRPLLFRLDPEQAHALTLSALRVTHYVAPVRWALEIIYNAPPKPVEALGLTFKNPIGLAAGYDKDGIVMRGLATLGFGHIEIGTVTLRPQPGNPKPRVFRLVEDEAIINRMGFPSQGSEFLQRKLKPPSRSGVLQDIVGNQRRDKKRIDTARYTGGPILGINLGKNKDTPNEEAVFDYLALLENFAPYADYLAINISSPNTAGLRQLQGRDALEALLTQLHAQRQFEERKLERKLPLLVKLAPDLSASELDDAVDVILRTHMDGVIATNTTLARGDLRSSYQDEPGGLSGSPLRARSEAALHQIVKRVNSKIPIVSVGGIMSPDDAKRRLDSGAALVQVYTGLVYRGPGFVKEIVRAL
jgi:dihydroorotate dehydrogenase